MPRLLQPYVDRQTYQEENYVNINNLTTEQYELIQTCIQQQITRSELAQSFRTEDEVKVLKLGLQNLKTIEKILK
jgi:hypothetical protein